MRLSIASKDGRDFPRWPGDNLSSKDRKLHYEFTIAPDDIVLPDLLEKWRDSIPFLEALISLHPGKGRVLVRLKKEATPKAFGVKYYYQIPDAVIGMLPVT